MPRRRSESPSIAATMLGARQDYAAMRDSRFRRKRPGVSGNYAGDADSHTWDEWRFAEMREYAEAMVRDDAVIKPLVQRVIHNVIRTGFRYEPDTGDESLNLDLWQRWDEWSRDPAACDVAGVLTFSDYERLAVWQEIVAGDVFIAGNEEGALQAYEAGRCRSPLRSKKRIVHGIEVDERRRRLRYWFTKDQPGIAYRGLVGDFDQVSAYDGDGYEQVWHLFDPMRFTQTRGVTAFHGVMDNAGMLNDIEFALLVKEQMAAFLAWEEQTTNEYNADLQYGSRETEARTDGTTQTIEEMAPGTITKLPKGKSLKMHQSSISSVETIAHLKHTLGTLAVALGLPLCIARLDASETNFSSQRFVTDQAKLGFLTNQQRYEDRFHRKAVTFKIRDWMSTDPALRNAAKREGITVFRHRWHKPRWPYIQPLQDAMADQTKLEAGLSSLRRIHAERGDDFEDVATESVADNEYWIGKAIEGQRRLREKYGDDAKDVHWSHLYHRAYPKGIQVNDTLELPNDGTTPATAPQKPAAMQVTHQVGGRAVTVDVVE